MAIILDMPIAKVECAKSPPLITVTRPRGGVHVIEVTSEMCADATALDPPKMATVEDTDGKLRITKVFTLK